MGGVNDGPAVLFVQATDLAYYPPLMNACVLFANQGWNVTALSAPFSGSALTMQPHPRIVIRQIRERASHVMSKGSYSRYIFEAIATAKRLRPRIVYASDPLGAVPGLLAAKMSGARLIY